MSNNVPVRFLKSWRSYFKNDTAGFPQEVAEELVDGGVAEYTAGSTAAKAKSGGKGGGKGNAKSAAAGGESVSPPAPEPGGGEGQAGGAGDETGADDEKP
ncbi:hypothetical protein P3W55_13250 [Pseudomonas citronellolis]|uniref:Uncharacterized protein n=1 Tax=Pseudomonas citronellolis TaxID=53408 RepID=A0AAW6P4P3_9PSED|nr:hypothetical protein [Pseudomonas citronellolis]MDF3842676.1 hypothetical protein [Pseudomonas citronellolis]